MAKNDDVEIEIEISDELAVRLNEEVARTGKTVDEIINEAIRQSLKTGLNNGKEEDVTTLQAELQKTDESTEDYLKRMVALATAEQRTVLVVIENRCVDVKPDTTIDYLRGFLDGFHAGESTPNNFMGFN